MTNDNLEPIIFLIDDNEMALNEFEERLCIEESSQVQEMILHYPTIYIHNLQESNEYEVYVGESGHVIQRTKEHYREARNDKTWQCQFLRNRARLFLIGHPHFNKSLTLDRENRLMHFDRIFHKVWARLRKEDPVLFPVESKITDSAIFKASPLHKPTPFINRHTKEKPVDVAFIDEAHLLLTQGKQSFRGKNQLRDIIERAKVTVVMFDENQILTAEQYMEAQDIETYKSDAMKNNLYIELKNQLRMLAAKETVDWIDSFTKDRMLKTIPKDDTGYEVRIFDKPEDLEKEIRKKGASEETALSRIIATYDWNYSDSKPQKGRMFRYWEVAIDTWHKPWNNELKKEMEKS